MSIDVDGYVADVVEILNKNTSWQWRVEDGNHDRHRRLVTAAGHRWGLVHLDGHRASGGTFEVSPDLGQEVIPGGYMVHQQWWRNNMRDAFNAESGMSFRVGARTRPAYLAGQLHDRHPSYCQVVRRYETALEERIAAAHRRTELHAKTRDACGDNKVDGFDDSVFWQPPGTNGVWQSHCNILISPPCGDGDIVDVKGSLPHGAVLAMITALNEWQAAQQQ